MLQRNDTDYALTVGTDPVTVLEPGDTLDHPDPVAGLTAVGAPEPEPEPATPVPAPAGKAAPTPTAAEEATR